MSNQATGSATGVSATLKVVAILGVIAMAILGIMLVFGAVSMDDVGPLAGKIGVLAVIVAIATAAIGLISSTTRR